MTTILVQKGSKFFYCETCHYTSCRKSQYDRHLLTSKHLDTTKPLQNTTFLVPDYICNSCNKQYKHHSSLWKHKKTCNIIQTPKSQENAMNVILEVVKQNQELQKQNQEFKDLIVEQNNKMLETFQEVCKNGIVNNSNTNNVNSNNKTFNLQVFLNEDCKDAMNVTQFIDSFVLQLSDFENVGKLGFVNGISDIIIKKLKALDISERPIHCTDQKRQVLYARVLDKWEKAGDDNKILRKIIKCVAFKNSKNIQLFRDKYPDCMNWDSKHADRYQKMRIESLGGLGNEDVDNENKIIRKIAREILIDKHVSS